MLKIITTLTLFLIGILAKGQEVEMRKVSSFSKVNVKHGIELVYTESATPSLRIEAATQSDLKNISTIFSGSTLIIDVLKDTNFNEKNANIKVYLAGNNLERMEAGTNAKITIADGLTSENLSIILKSGASFTGALKVNRTTKLVAADNTIFNGRIESGSLTGNFTKNAKINLTGKAEKATFETTNSVILSARNFISNGINMKASGNSVASIYANSNLTVDVADGAKITYSGFPDNVNLNEDAVAFQKQNCNRMLTLN